MAKTIKALVMENRDVFVQKQLLLKTLMVFLGSLILYISAKIQVPTGIVKLSFQPQVAVMMGMLLGPRIGGAAVLLYLAEGAMGLPVFQSTPERGIGLAYMVGPTGGYLLGFLVGACISGSLMEHFRPRNFWAILGISLLGCSVLQFMGAAWLGYLFSPKIAWNVTLGLLAPSLLKVVITSSIVRLAYPRLMER